MSEKFSQVMAEIPYVRAALGWIPLVTPTSQIVGTQAMLNVKFGRWANVSQPAIDIALGKYGRTPGPIDPAVLELAQKKSGQRRIETRPADALPPRLPALRQELAAKGLPTNDEMAVLHAMFPHELAALYREKTTLPIAATPARISSTPALRYALTIAGHRTEVSIAEVL